MTEFEIKQIHQLLVRRAFQMQELKKNGKIQTLEVHKSIGSNVADAESGRASSSKYLHYVSKQSMRNQVLKHAQPGEMQIEDLMEFAKRLNGSSDA